MKSRLFTVLGLMLVANLASADLAGNWVLTVDSPQGTSNPTMELKQDGDTVTGSYTGSMGTAPIKGTAKGDAFSLTVNVDFQGQAFAIVYDGTQSGDTMKGSINFADMGGAEFTGKKQ